MPNIAEQPRDRTLDGNHRRLGIQAPRPVMRTTLVLMMICLAGFAALAAVLALAPTGLTSLDRDIVLAVHGLAVDLGTIDALLVLDVLTGPYLLRVPLAVAAIVLAVRREWIAAIALAVLIWGSIGVSPLVKLLFDRPRPRLEEPVFELSSLSFPSGHAVIAGVFAAALILVAAPRIRSAPARMLVLVIAAGIGLLGGLHRIGLGVHYPSDVLAGWMLGAATALIAAPWLWPPASAARESDPAPSR